MKGGSSFGRNQSKQGFSQKNWLKNSFLKKMSSSIDCFAWLIAGRECIRKGNPPVCKLACRGLYADVTKKYPSSPLWQLIIILGMTQKNKEQTVRNCWWWPENMRDTKTTGGKIFSTVILQGQQTTSVSSVLNISWLPNSPWYLSGQKECRAPDDPHLLWHFDIW